MTTGLPGSSITELLGERVVALERCRWGFTNETALATLQSGRRVIVQRVAQADHAARLARLSIALPPLLEPIGISLPYLLTADLTITPPLLAREYIPGETANLLLDDSARSARLADAMGAQLALLAHAPTAITWLDHSWADPEALAGAASRWLSACAASLAPDAYTALTTTIDTLAEGWIGGVRLAHGDFCPVNIIVQEERIAGLIDWESARIANPCFDAAWWGWVMRYHHPERWKADWPALLKAAGLPEPDAIAAHINALQRLRCLELLNDAQHPPARAAWAERLSATLAWQY